MPEEKQNVHLLLIGNSKVGKTTFAAKAAAAGFKVLYIDGDASRPSIMSAPKEALSRIFYLQFGDMISESGVYTPRFALLTKKLLSGGTFAWDDTLNRMFTEDEASRGHTRVDINVAKLSSDWVIVFDSWSSISHSIMTAVAMNAGVDLSDMDRAGQGVYGSANNFATDLASKIRAIGCHVIVIAHPDEFTKFKVKPGSVKEAQRTENREVEFARMIPKSISRPHGMSLPSYFTDVAWMELNYANKRILDFDGTRDRDAGGRFTGKNLVDEVGFAQLVEQAGGRIPKSVSFENDPGLVITRNWEPPVGVAPKTTVMTPQSAATPGTVQLGVSPTKIPQGLALNFNIKPKA